MRRKVYKSNQKLMQHRYKGSLHVAFRDELGPHSIRINLLLVCRSLLSGRLRARLLQCRLSLKPRGWVERRRRSIPAGIGLSSNGAEAALDTKVHLRLQQQRLLNDSWQKLSVLASTSASFGHKAVTTMTLVALGHTAECTNRPIINVTLKMLACVGQSDRL